MQQDLQVNLSLRKYFRNISLIRVEGYSSEEEDPSDELADLCLFPPLKRVRFVFTESLSLIIFPGLSSRCL